MKLRAIRCAAFRRFRDPVAVEGLSDGLNVLAGENERGKSTIFAALESAFTLRHRVTGAALQGLQPHTGGDPIVEVEFECRDRRYRLRKKFGRKPGATLVDVTAARVIASGDDAEQRLAELIIPSAQQTLLANLDLVWVKQQASLALPDLVAKSGGDAIRVAAEAEMAAAAVGSLFQDVQTRVAKRLDDQLTLKSRQPKANSPYAQAKAAQDDLRKRLADAETYAATQSQRIARYGEIIAALKDDTTSDATRLNDEAQRLLRQVEHVKEARHALAVANEAFAARSEKLQTAERLQADVTRGDAQMRRLESDLTEAVKHDATIKTVAAKLNAIAITPAILKRLGEIKSAIDVRTASLSAQAVRVDIEPTEHGADIMTVDQMPLGTRRSFNVTDETDITIPKIARIRIVAANRETARIAIADKERLEREWSDTLGKFGCASLADVEVLLEQRAQLSEQLDAARFALRGLAPNGVEALQQARSVLKASLAETRAALPSAEAIKAAALQRDEAKADRERLALAALSDQAFDTLQRAYKQAATEATTWQNRRQSLEREAERLSAELVGADDDNRAGQVQALREALTRATLDVETYKRDTDALLLLAATLNDAALQTAAGLEQALAVRLQPLLARVFDTVSANVSPSFDVHALDRGGGAESVSSLSDGTREQISVLVRVAFAKLLASNGTSLPLVLDDPLVYSDDQRLAVLAALLSEHAGLGGTQVLLLTCRSTAFRQALAHGEPTWLTFKAWSVGDISD